MGEEQIMLMREECGRVHMREIVLKKEEDTFEENKTLREKQLLERKKTLDYHTKLLEQQEQKI